MRLQLLDTALLPRAAATSFKKGQDVRYLYIHLPLLIILLLTIDQLPFYRKCSSGYPFIHATTSLTERGAISEIIG